MATLELVVESGELFDVRRFAVTESVSGLFSIGLWVHSDNPGIDLDAIVGKPATLRIDSGNALAPLGGARFWSGMTRSMEQVHAGVQWTKNLSTYHLEIVPETWALTQRRNHRIFQDATIPAMLDVLLREWRIKYAWDIDAAVYPVLEYRVQYGESDYDFMSRLLEEAGIAFSFPEAKAGSVLTLSDRLHVGIPRAGTPIRYLDNPSPKEAAEYVTIARFAHEVRPGALAIRDYDFRSPGFTLRGEALKAPSPEDRYEQYQYRPGAFVVATNDKSETPMADARGTYRHDADAGGKRAERALVAARVGKRRLSFKLSTVDLWPGAVFLVQDHPELPKTLPLLCTDFAISGAPNEEWSMTGRAVPADVPYHPPQRTPKPRLRGVQSALVVGPDKTEILVDEHGRVRVRFPWDRYGIKDERSSCWIRVSQGWAGAGFGFAMHPRIGQEVLIAFLDGDPDAPIVVGRVYNRTHPVPYKLPEKKTRSTYKSESSTGSAGYNEILFEDSAGKELVYLQAQRNLRRLVKNNETITDGADRDKFVTDQEIETTDLDRMELTNRDRVEQIDGYRTVLAEKNLSKLVHGDEIERIEEDQLLYVGKEQHITVKGTKRELVIVDSHLRVEGCRNEGLGGLSRVVGGQQDFKAGGSYLLCTDHEAHLKSNTDIAAEAPDITVKGPGGFIRIDSSGVTIQGVLVKINDGGSPGSGGGAKPSRAELPKEALVEVPDKPPPADAGMNDGEVPDGPAASVLVSIKNEAGIKGGCPFIAKGKTHKYSAVGTPEGGAYLWTAKGHVSIVGSAISPTVEVKGDATSGALEDSELTVQYTVPGGAANDMMKLTVHTVTKIEARLRATPCLRDKSRANAMSPKASAKDDKTIDASAVTVVRGCGDLKLHAVVSPAGVPIAWDVERAADDDPALAGGPPTHVFDGGSDKRTLRTDATGSFHVHAFVDCDGDGKRGPDESGLILNVNMVEVEILPGAANNRIIKSDAHFTGARSNAAVLVVDSSATAGAVPATNAVYNDALFTSYGLSVKVTVKLVGGGPNQRRGVPVVGLGYIQQAAGDTFKGVYADGRTVKEVIVQDVATPDPIVVGAPAMLRFPIRDTRGPSVNGTGTFIISSSDNDKSNLPGGGQKRVCRYLEPPAIALQMTHPVTGSALASISGANKFAVFFSAFSSDFDENFTVIASSAWSLTFGTYTQAAGWTNAGARVNAPKTMTVHHPGKLAESMRAERCPPNFVDNLRLDAR